MRKEESIVAEYLPFEKHIYDLKKRLAEAPEAPVREALMAELEREMTATYANMTAWQRVQLARHPLRPRMLDYLPLLFEDFLELHGDRALGDDPAMVCGLARFQGQTVFVAGQQKGVSTEEKVCRNFGMAHPSGYRKALRMFETAERLGFPVLTFVDTPAAHPGIEAEQRGQGFAIAQNLLKLSGLRTPIFSVVLSEGGSGGALGIAVADRVVMLEYAVYMICPPERCAEILWRNVEKKDLAAAALKVTAPDLLELGAIDGMLPEGNRPAHHDTARAANLLANEIERFLDGVARREWTLERRQQRFQNIGRWEEEAELALARPQGPRARRAGGGS